MKALTERAVLSVICAVLLTFSFDTLSAIPPKPEPPRLVNDLAGLFTASQSAELEARLVAFNDTTSTQIIVLTVNDLEGMDSFTYAVEVGETWGVGSSQFDNGVVILVKPKTENEGGDVYIAVGYGLEGAIPDAYAKRIINEIMIPGFKGDDYYGAVSGACDKIISLASGEDFGEVSAEEDSSLFSIILTIALVVALFYWFSKKSKNGGGGTTGGSGSRRSGSTVVPPMMGGFGSSRSGGFGGFGGGSFGGGGAGGKW